MRGLFDRAVAFTWRWRGTNHFRFALIWFIMGSVMEYRTDDLRIKEIKELLTPARLLGEVPLTQKAAKTVYETRQAIHRILHGADDRLLVIMGPCSIHDVKAAHEYAGKLKKAKERLAGDLLAVMRVYF